MNTVTFQTLLKQRYQTSKDEPFVFERKSGKYRALTFKELIEKSARIAQLLIREGLKGKKIAIYSENSSMWICTDLAIMSFVGISVGLSKEYDGEDLIRSIQTFEVDALFYSEAKKETVNKAKEKFPNLQIFHLEQIDALISAENRNENETHLLVNRMLSTAEKRVSRQEEARAHAVRQCTYDECVKVVLTAGTTSMPKGVCLSEKNIFAGYRSLQKRAPMDQRDVCYLFLPLHHTYAGIYNVIYSLISGMKIYLSTGTDHIAEELKIVNPTVFCGVPIIFKNFYQYANGDAQKLAHFFGNRIRYLFTGGAHLEEEIRAFYHRCGLKLLSAYALSETSSSLAIDYANTTNLKSSGRVFEDIHVKIADPDENAIGEIRVKGDCVFSGYMNDEKATKEAFDEEGYFKTGDLGYLDSEGNIYVTGRKKKVLLSAHGENIYPEDIAQRLMQKNSNINKIKIYSVEDELRAQFFLQKEDEFDYQGLIESYNKNVPNYRKINRFECVIDSVDKRLKQ